MTPGGHVHIISAGEKIDKTYPALLRTLPGITRTCVVADGQTYGSSRDPVIENQRLTTRTAVEAVKAVSASLALPFSREMVFDPVYESARTILTKIRRENPRARFTFDLSEGPKPLCMALLGLASWMGGEVYTSFDGQIPRVLPMANQNLRAMLANGNYQTILAVLIKHRHLGNGSSSEPWVARQYLFRQVWPYYIRSRTRTPKPGDPVIHYKGGRKPANNLSQATFSSFITHLRTAGLIEEGQDTGNRKEKAYRITGPGETAFRFFADPSLNTTVKSVLDHG
jgi:hypothetical protein